MFYLVEKKTKLKGTSKQLKALDNMLENGGNVSKAMRDAGYSEATAKNPQKFKKTEVFKQLMNELITDEALVEVINKGLHAQKPVVVDGKITDYDDHSTRHKFVETVLKLKGYTKEESSSVFNFIGNNKNNFSFDKYRK